MLEFMDYVQNAFYEATHWNQDNSYSTLTATALALLDFETPKGLRLNASSLAAPNFATSYTLGSVGVVDGSVSYLYSSTPLQRPSRSTDIDLRHVIQGYHQLKEFGKQEKFGSWEASRKEAHLDRKDAMLYGRLFLPRSTLEALYVRRLSPTKQLKISCVSDSSLPNGGTILALLQSDVGKYSTEYLYSTDSALFGIRGLYNFGPDPRKATATLDNTAVGIPPESVHGRFSAGAELYYGALNKSGGLSTGIRFTTLPQYTGFPYTMTLTLNPLMGNLSSSYAVKAGPNLALCSRFGFNFYSYESDLQVGCELWRWRHKPDIEWAVRKIRPDWKHMTTASHEDVSGVLKTRVDQDWNIGVLWEGRIKDLLVSAGVSLDLKRRDQIFRAVGIELQYSS